MQIKSAVKVSLKGRGPLTLSSRDHVATGGEGSVYKKARTIIKLYTDKQKMVRDGMPDKLDLLSRMKHPYIVAPKGLVTNSRDLPIGYYMDFVKGEPLSRVFTNDFRQRESFSDDNASLLVDRMRMAMRYTHDHHATMVDPNEMNWIAVLGRKDGPEPRILDVDSWAIDRFPAKVIMPSVRDWHTKGFNSLTDWFAWGVVTFQIYSGIHPYKGGLPRYKPNELERRMKNNRSVFTSGIRLNKAVRDFSNIPGPLLDWYSATFEKGERSIPPSPFDKGISTTKLARVIHTVVTTSGMLRHEKIFTEVNDPVTRAYHCGVVLLKSGKLFDLATKQEIETSVSHDCEVVKINGNWLIADIVNDQFKFMYINSVNLRKEELDLQITGTKLLRYENRLFVVTDKGLTEITVKSLGKTILTTGQTWGVLVNSTRFYDGVGIQDVMGATYVVLPFGEKACAQVRVRELDGLKPVMAKAGNRFVAIIVVDKKGNYRKIELSFNKDYTSYSIWEGGCDTSDLNMAILPKGVTAIIVEDGEFNIFVPSTCKLKKIQDKTIATDMILGNWDNKVVYLHKGSVWSVSMK